MASTPSPETGKSLEAAPEQKTSFIVSQPNKLEGLLETISLIDKVSERMGEDKSGDLGGSSGSTTGGTQGDDDAQQSSRQSAIADLPEPRVMQQKLEKHIHKEVQQLHKQVKKLTRVHKPGQAHAVNELYARIRRLNSIAAELIEASYDALKRLYIRIFIDKQNLS